MACTPTAPALGNGGVGGVETGVWLRFAGCWYSTVSSMFVTDLSQGDKAENVRGHRMSSVALCMPMHGHTYLPHMYIHTHNTCTKIHKITVVRHSFWTMM